MWLPMGGFDKMILDEINFVKMISKSMHKSKIPINNYFINLNRKLLSIKKIMIKNSDMKYIWISN